MAPWSSRADGGKHPRHPGPGIRCFAGAPMLQIPSFGLSPLCLMKMCSTPRGGTEMQSFKETLDNVKDSSSSGTVTLLLESWSSGDLSAAEEVLPLVYEELRR